MFSSVVYCFAQEQDEFEVEVLKYKDWKYEAKFLLTISNSTSNYCVIILRQPAAICSSTVIQLVNLHVV